MANNTICCGASLAAALLEATRPRMFPVWVSSGIVPAAVAIMNGVFDSITFVFEILLCWLLLTLSCWADEYGDLDHGVDNENRIGPHRPLQRGEITMIQMFTACKVLAIVSFIVGLVLISYSCIKTPTSPWVALFFVGIGIFAIACAFLYTIGKRPYGYRGWGDLSAYFFFGPVACVGGYWLYGHTMDWSVLLPASSVGLLLVVTINLQNLRDFENDKANGKNTTAICLGYKNAIIYHYVLVLSAMVLYLLFPIINERTNPAHYAFIFAFIPLISHIIQFKITLGLGKPEKLDTLMWPLCRGMLIACVAFCVCVVLPV